MPNHVSDPSGSLPAADASLWACIHFVDLGLPSGLLWAAYDVESPNVEGCSLPTYDQARELIENCNFFIREIPFGEKDICARGPNREIIGFPMKEYPGTLGPAGCCWCQGDSSSSDFAYFLLLSEDSLTVGMGRRTLPFPFRLVREG